jgi:hypothetical protein
LRTSVAIYGLSLIAIAAALIVRILLNPLLGDRFPLITLVLALAYATWYGGRGPAVVAMVAGAAGAVFFLMPPIYSFAISSQDHRIALGFYAVIGFILISMIESLQKARRRAGEESELLRTTLSSIGDGVITTNVDGSVTSMNAVAESLTGWRREDAAGRLLDSVFRIVDERTGQPLPTATARILRQGIFDGQLNFAILVSKSGKERPIDGNIAPIRDDNSRVVGVVLIFRDISARRQSESRFQMAVQAAPNGMLMVRNDGVITFANINAEQMFGYDHDGLVGLPAKELIPDRLRHEVSPYTESFPGSWPSRAAGHAREFYGLRRDGSEFPVEIGLNPILTDDGDFILASVIDITERRQRFREFLLSVLANAVDAIITCDERGVILSFNQVAEKLFAYSSSEVVGHNVKLLIPEPYHSQLDRYLSNYRETGQARIVGAGREMVGRRKDGATFPIDLGVSEFLLDGRRHFNSVVRDITDRKKLEEQLQQSQKIEAVGQLAGGIAHDFNNLLTVICGYGELLLMKLKPPDPNRELVSFIMEAGARATTLTNQLLAFSRKQVLELKVLDLNDLVRNVETIIQRLIGEDVQLSVILNPTIGCVRADPGQVEQVLINFAVNARDAMPQGGNLEIETGTAEFDEHYAQKHAGCKPGQYVRLSVTDTGCGMDPGIQSRIFEPFFTTKEVGKGTGLGLAMVYGIVKQSDGFIVVESEPGKGSSFNVYLPQVGLTAPEKVPSPSPVLPPAGAEKILLVEDAQAVRQLAERILISCGYSVLSASDGFEALDILSRDQGIPIDLLFCDVVMPLMSGRELAEQVVALKPGIKVLFTSGYTDDVVLRHGIIQSETAFLQKPYSTIQLTQKIREVLARDTQTLGAAPTA